MGERPHDNNNNKLAPAGDGRSLAASKAKRFSSPIPAPAAPPQATPKPAAPEAQGKMADITAKPVVAREAVAEGFLRLSPATLQAMSSGALPKGDAFGPARIAGIMAAKKTPEWIPLCHPIPITGIEVDCTRESEGVRVRATVRTLAQTGVEMEALCAASAALLTVWDMVKALEKDSTGNYPGTSIEGIRVIRKTKGAP